MLKKSLTSAHIMPRVKAILSEQIMGDLPVERISVSRPFAYVGVDFADPFPVKCTKHHSIKYLKYYAALYVCLATKAVHIETVSDLSTFAFLESLTRFSTRRGIPNTIWNDNATNFTYTHNVLDQHCSNVSISWKFIPPLSPY